MTTSTLPGPAWYRLRFIGAILVGSGLLFALLILGGYFSGTSGAGAAPLFDVGFFATGLAMIGSSMWVRKAHPDWK